MVLLIIRGIHNGEGLQVDGYTRKFDVVSSRTETREILSSVYESLRLKGYNPVNQIVGYILSEDPTYITNYNNARSLICRLDRDELLQELVKYYLEK
jgi:uncharacterized protein (UPF0297 family)